MTLGPSLWPYIQFSHEIKDFDFSVSDADRVDAWIQYIQNYTTVNGHSWWSEYVNTKDDFLSGLFEFTSFFLSGLLLPNISTALDDGSLTWDNTLYQTLIGDAGYPALPWNATDPSNFGETVAEALTDLVPACLMQWCGLSPSCQVLVVDGKLPCSPTQILRNGVLTWTPTWDCLNLICKDPGLTKVNGDISGIGVAVSYYMQLGIAALGCAVLLAFAAMKLDYENKAARALDPEASQNMYDLAGAEAKAASFYARWQKVHKQASKLILALVDFQKAQCFFAISIQIAVFVSLHTNDNNIIDLWALSNVTQTGTGPIILNLFTLLLFHKPSWFQFGLSSLTFWMTVIAMYQHDLKYARDLKITVPQSSGGPIVCQNQPPHSLCTTVQSRGYIPRWPHGPTWIFGFCVGIYTILAFVQLSQQSWFRSFRRLLKFHSLSDSSTSEHSRPAFDPSYEFGWSSLYITRYAARYNVSRLAIWVTLILIVTFMVLVPIQFRTFTDLTNHSLDFNTWTFGQVIAVVLWMPALAEYMYQQGTAWRFRKNRNISGIKVAFNHRLPEPLTIAVDENSPSPIYQWWAELLARGKRPRSGYNDTSTHYTNAPMISSLDSWGHDPSEISIGPDGWQRVPTDLR